MASPLFVLFTCLVFCQISSAHRIEILTTSRPDGGVVSEGDCSSPADVVFIVDGSASMVADEFQKQVDFVRTFIEDMDVSFDKVRVGVITFSTAVHNAFNLNTYKTKQEVLAALDRVAYPKGRTHTWLVLEYIRKYAFTVDNGGRVGIPKIAIILTDGRSNMKLKTLEEAKLLHKDPIRVYAIGVGNNLDKDELRAIASKQENIYLVQDFNALKTIENTVKQNICKKVCGLNPTDIIFMLDESTSIWDKDYSKQMDFLVSFIKDAIIGQKNTQIGVVTFSTGVVNRIYLNQYQKRRGLLDAVKAIQRYHGDTYTDKGLRYITGAGFAAEHGGRPGVPHIVIVITDGQSTRPIETKSAAKEMHNAGITVFAIGVGSAIDPDELKTISGDQSRVYEVISYDALKNIESALFSKVCTVERIKVGH